MDGKRGVASFYEKSKVNRLWRFGVHQNLIVLNRNARTSAICTAKARCMTYALETSPEPNHVACESKGHAYDNNNRTTGNEGFTVSFSHSKASLRFEGEQRLLGKHGLPNETSGWLWASNLRPERPPGCYVLPLKSSFRGGGGYVVYVCRGLVK